MRRGKWSIPMGDSVTTLEVDVLDSGEVAFAMYSTYLDQYVDALLPTAVVEEVITLIKSEGAPSP